MMKLFDFLLTLLIPSLILIHLIVAPYTKVEESFNLQATHDILVYSTPTHDIGARLRASYDHFEFPGAVPRTFVGAAALAGISRPILQIVGWQYGQLVIRAVLGLFNAFALLRYKNGLDKAFGKEVGRWYVLLQASQFHVIYYASRTLPNMFAFGLSTLALRELLPMPTSSSSIRHADSFSKRHKLAIYLLVLAGAIFRSELALLLATQLSFMLLQPVISLQSIVPIGLYSAVIALIISIPVDSYFWQRPIWPELAGFFYNAIQGKSTDWGTSPFHAYFTSFLPKLLLNPLAPLLLIPLALYYPATRPFARALVVPSLAFIAIYSYQPHKEARFIIYAVPPLTACAALGMNYVFTRRSRSILIRILSIFVIISIIGSFIVSTIMLGISSLNYPGGEALFELHQIVSAGGGDANEHMNASLNVHMDVLACMTGVSRFQQDFPTPPFSHYLSLLSTYLDPSLSSLLSNPLNHTSIHMPPTMQYHFQYDKTEEPATTLLDPAFWARFDYVLTESPETVIGKWNVVHTVYGYAGIEFLRPGMASRSVLDDELEVSKLWKEMGGEVVTVAPDDKEMGNVGQRDGVGGGTEDKISIRNKSKREVFQDDVERLGLYAAIREGTRRWITKGWWVGPRMEAKIRILQRAPL